MKKILKEPDARLRQISQPIVKFTGKVGRKNHDLFWDMVKVFQETNAAGLAAIQLGQAVQMILIHDEHLSHVGLRSYIVMINPKILWSERPVVDTEECLSCPGKSVRVCRASRISVVWYNLSGQVFEQGFTGIEARIIQHEIDHLNGKLITDEEREEEHA